MQKVLKTTNDIYDRVLTVVFIILLLYSMYIAYDAWYIRYKSSGSNYAAYRPSKENVEAYKELGEECIGWITLDDTTIDYPIMQAKDNAKYLNMNAYGEYSLAGSIFLDWKCDPTFKTPFNLIYGHHMGISGNSARSKSKAPMFGVLDAFQDEKYFNEHLTGTLTADGKEMPIDVFAFMQTDASEGVIFDPTGHTGQYDYIKTNSMIFKEPGNKERIIALATCKDPGTTERTILFCSILDKEINHES